VLRRGFISLECEDLERKLVAGGRGGYCFENNLLLCLALRSLGFGATPMLARVRWNTPPDEPQPFGHLVLVVSLPRMPTAAAATLAADPSSAGWLTMQAGRCDTFLVDVGFAGTNSIAPVAAASAEVQRLPEGNFRLLPEPAGTGSADSGAQPSCQLQLPPLSAAQFALQRQVRGCWRDLYVVRNEPACDADIAQANWYNCTHPDARFVSSFFVSRVGGDERHHIVNGSYIYRHKDGTLEEEELTTRLRLLRLLTTVFGIRLPEETIGIDRFLEPATDAD